MHNRIGKLLIAHPRFPIQSPFARTVVYIYQDDSVNGTVGVVLNRKSETSVQHLAYKQGVSFGDNRPMVHLGGPVNPNALVLLHSNDWHSSNTTAAGPTLRISSDTHMLHKMSYDTNQPVYWRLFVGYSTWQVGQLDCEINGKFPFESQMWLTAESNDDIIFGYNGEQQWEKALELCSQQMMDQYF